MLKRRLLLECLESRQLLAVTTPGTLNRPADPVVMTGADVPAVLGIAPEDLVAFRDTGSGWEQIPIQVDERALATMHQIYGQAINHPNLTILTYADPNTYVGADPDSTLDADDEIAFMAKDTGGRVSLSQAAPADVDPASRVELVISDPVDAGNQGWVYLFQRTSGALSPGAGVSYVDYQFNLLVGNGNYLANYDTASGPNPENSTIETDYYSRRFVERWITDELNIKVGTDVDLLDRHRFQFAPGFGGRSEDTFSAGEGAFIINKSGPVRAIRSWVGANSGPYTQREEIYYEQREDVYTYLRVHAIPAGMDLFDYNAAASGMIYYNELNPAGVLVDGQPDSVTTGAYEWELLVGAQGSLSQSHVLDTNLPGYSQTSYYLDDITPPAGETQVTGDSESWGQSGPWIHNLASTDVGSPYYLTSLRALYYGGPDVTTADAERHNELVHNPLQAAIDGSPQPAAILGRHVFYNESKFDGGTPGVSTSDDLAIATDKSAYLPGSGAATFDNVTSYSRGINGIMIDIAAPAGTLSIDDFAFKMSAQSGANNTPSTWSAAPAPAAFSVRPGAGVSGSDRVEIIWPAGAIENRWLEVLVEGDDALGANNTNTGLAASDIFYFGNRIGETGSGTPGLAITNASDEIAARNNPGFGAAVTNPFDFDRSGIVNALDSIVARNNVGTLTYINLSDPPAAPQGSSGEPTAAVALALAEQQFRDEVVREQASVASTGPDLQSTTRSSRTASAPQLLVTSALVELELVANETPLDELVGDELLASLTS